MITPNTVENARYAEGGEGSQWLLVDLDGQTVAIHSEQKHLSLYGVVTLRNPPAAPESTYHRQYVYILKPEPAEGINEPVLIEAATGDTRVVGLARQFWHDIEAENWRPGKRIL